MELSSNSLENKSPAVVGVPKSLQISSFKSIYIYPQTFWSPTTKAVIKKQVRIFAFVIMPNHIHSVWKINKAIDKSNFQRDILKYTGQKIMRDLEKNHIEIYKSLYVGAKDRKYQFWERNSHILLLVTKKFAIKILIYSIFINCKLFGTPTTAGKGLNKSVCL